MSQTVELDNYTELNIGEQTYLDTDHAAGVTALTVENNQGFSATNYFIIGALGTEASEQRIVSSVGTTVTITATAATVKAHARQEPITKLFGNKIRVYRADNVDGSIPDDADFALLPSGTIDIDFDQQTTEFTDSGGSDSKWYKYVYYNSVTDTETSLADSPAARGGGYAQYCTVQEIREEAGMVGNPFISGGHIAVKRAAAQAEIDSALVGVYTVPFTDPINEFIADITKRLAAGLLLLEDYGPMSSGTNKDGTAKVNGARADLAALKAKQKELTDENGGSLAISGAAGWRAWPNSTTATTDTTEGGGERKFRVGDRY